MIYSEFSAQVRRHLEEFTENTWSDDSLMHWTNEAVKDLARKVRPRRDEQYATAIAGRMDYELPADTLSVIAVAYVSVDGTYSRLARESVDDLVARSAYEPSGIPVAFAVDDEALYLRPAPSDAGTVRFWRFHLPPAVTEATDTVPFADQYATALEYAVLKRAFEQINDWTSANAYRDRYEQAVHDMTVQEQIEDSALMPSSPVEVY